VEPSAAVGSWMIDGFGAMLALGAWVIFVLLWGVWRWLFQAEPDAIRPAGPIE